MSVGLGMLCVELCDSCSSHCDVNRGLSLFLCLVGLGLVSHNRPNPARFESLIWCLIVCRIVFREGYLPWDLGYSSSMCGIMVGIFAERNADDCVWNRIVSNEIYP